VSDLTPEHTAEKDARCRNCGAVLRRTSPAFFGEWVSNDGNHAMCPSNPETFSHEPRVIPPGNGDTHGEELNALAPVVAQMLADERETTYPLSLADTQRIVDHLIHDGSRDGLILGNLLNASMGASARRRAARIARGGTNET